MNISLPEAVRTFVEEQVASGSYTTAEEYLAALVREDQKRRAQEKLEALLVEGLESGEATEMTDADWDELRRRFDSRHGAPVGD